MAGQPRARVYVDGFNLYYGALRHTPYKWLDLVAWAQRMLPALEVDKVVYCTARVSARATDPGAPLRQDIYLRALRTMEPRIEVIQGTFQVKPTRMLRISEPSCTCCSGTSATCACCQGATVNVSKTEEKGSDVNLAVELVKDGYTDRYDVALVVSGDSDIQSAVDTVRGLGKTVIVADPRNRKSRPLVGDEKRKVRKASLAASQLPTALVDAAGRTITKPATW